MESRDKGDFPEQCRIDLPRGRWVPDAVLIDTSHLSESQREAFRALSMVPTSKIRVRRGMNLLWSVMYHVSIGLAIIMPIWLGIQIAMW